MWNSLGPDVLRFDGCTPPPPPPPPLPPPGGGVPFAACMRSPEEVAALLRDIKLATRSRAERCHSLHHHRMPAAKQVLPNGLSSSLKNWRFPALVWKIPLLHGAQTRLVEDAAVAGHAPGALSRLGTDRIQGQRAALFKITQEIPVGLQACHRGQRGKPGRGGPGILLRL